MLENLYIITNAESHRSSSWDRTGGNIDCLTDIAPGETVTLLDTSGSGKVTHIWLTIMDHLPHDTVFRDMAIRMYWDGAETPSVDVPLGDFFGLGHALPPPFYAEKKFTITSQPVNVGVNERSMNCYWPMPFRKSARIEIYNNGYRSLKQLYYHVDYELGLQPIDCGLFHAIFHENTQLPGQDIMNLTGDENYVLLETEGRGHYVGCFMYVNSGSDGWWGEGDDMIFIDHEEKPTINGTGTEDYFNNAWCYHEPFSFPLYGCPLLHRRDDGGTYTTMYRFHVPDPIRFKEHIKVTIEHTWEADILKSYSSVAFWYHDKPITSRPKLEKLPSKIGGKIPFNENGEDVKLPFLEAPLIAQGANVRTICVIGQAWLDGGPAIHVETGDKPVDIVVDVPSNAIYQVQIAPLAAMLKTPVGIKVGDSRIELMPYEFENETDSKLVDFGNIKAIDQKIVLSLDANSTYPLRRIRLTKV